MDGIPTLALRVGTLSFVVVCVVYSLFRKKSKAPTDLVEALEFAQSKAKARKDGTTDVTLKDVAGLDVIKAEFLELVEFLKNPEQFANTGVKPPKGVLLEGPPGTGATLARLGGSACTCCFMHWDFAAPKCVIKQAHDYCHQNCRRTKRA